MNTKSMKTKDYESLPKGKIVIDFDMNKGKIALNGKDVTEEEVSCVLLLTLSNMLGVNLDELLNAVVECHEKLAGDIDDFVDNLIEIMPGKDADKTRLKEILMDGRPASECEDELDELIEKMLR